MFSTQRVLPVLVLVVVHTIVMVPAAFAGGTWMKTPDQQVEPGEEVDLVGYVWAADRPSVEESQWLAHFNLAPMPEYGSVEPQLISLGPVTVERSGLSAYLEYRVSLTFTIPEGLEPGNYMITVANEQGDYLGDLIGASLAIGVEPWPPSYYWPVDEPLVAQLPDNAWLRGPNWEITAGQVKRKIYPRCQWSCFLDPSLLEDPRAIVVDSSPTWAMTTTSLTTSTVESTIESTGPTTTSVLTLDIPSANPRDGATAPAPVEGEWRDLWWILLTVAGGFYLRLRRAQLPIEPDLRVVEDDVSEPASV
jgi:hypothetical protein